MKSYDSIEESKFIMYWMQIIYMVGQCVSIYHIVDLSG